LWEIALGIEDTEKKSVQTGKADEAKASRKDSAGEEHEKESDLVERLKAAETKAQENYDRLLRVTAEFDNYKKRADREMNDFRKFANESLVKEILPIVDNLQRALDVECTGNEDVVHRFREGVEMTLKGLLESLERFGVVPLEAYGKNFDPNFHQAVYQEESEKHPDNTVSRELQRGYLLNDRLLRPAMVVISKRPAPGEDKGPAESSGETKVKVTVH
jgi:molecular chaperone GrpE